MKSIAIYLEDDDAEKLEAYVENDSPGTKVSAWIRTTILKILREAEEAAAQK